MRVSIEIGDGEDLCYLLDREIRNKRMSRDILASMPPEQTTGSGNCSFGESVEWCDHDIAAYTAIRESLAFALQDDQKRTHTHFCEP